eukprot:262603-Amorphochlora_amoeboformis.AAC.1
MNPSNHSKRFRNTKKLHWDSSGMHTAHDAHELYRNVPEKIKVLCILGEISRKFRFYLRPASTGASLEFASSICWQR